MPRKKTSEIPHYEILYIISNKFTEEETKPIQEKIKKIITDNGGRITFEEEWNKKKLAYPIKHNNHGYYVLTEFDVEGKRLEKINETLRMTNEVIRFQIVIKEIKKAKPATTKARKVPEKKEVDLVKKEKDEKKIPKAKVDLKALDEKLDKILDTDDLL
ncbi:30S ribosomal protein S6 [Patescibacteria group bacterium]